MTHLRRLGVVVNPIAGMGGSVGVHGTDGPALAVARERGATPVAPHRARRALGRLVTLAPDLCVLTVDGSMGADHLPAALTGERQLQLLPAPYGVTTADDTHEAVRAMVAADVALVLFVGGDGTARDVVAETTDTVPVLGVPSGVKMHSGVFAVGPEVAGDTAARYLADPDRVGRVPAEVVDVDHADGLPRLFATASVPDAGTALQGAKVRGPASDRGELAALGREVSEEMDPRRLYLLGPGTSVAYVNAALGLPASLLGVDAVLDGRLVARDADEAELLRLLGRHPAATLVLGVIGGQGFLLGRGNQQLSPAVMSAVGADNVEILAAPGKIATLDPPVLRIDLGDEAPAAPISGYRRVRTGRGHSTVMLVVA